MNGARRVLYHLPELLKADANQWVLVVEGEKDVDNLRAVGLVATCNPMGADKWKYVEDGVLAGRKVAILPDRDKAGIKHALDVANRLRRKAVELRIVELPTTLKDVSDFIDARRQEGKTDDDIRRQILAAVEAAKPFTVETVKPATEGRISAWADAFIRDTVAPTWHRDGKSVFSSKINREIPVGNLWHYLTDADIAAIGETSEGLRSESYRGRLMLAKEVIAMAAARAVVTLPEVADVEKDQTVRADDLLDKLTAWLLRPRTFRTDTGILLTSTYFTWVNSLEPDAEHWQQCYVDPVFGRVHGNQPRIGTQGATLAHEIRYPHTRQLLRDLRACGLADTNAQFRVGGRIWRGLELSQSVFGAVARRGES